MKTNTIIGKRVAQMRQESKLTQAELASRCGMNEEQIAQIEESLTTPSLAPLLKVARALGARIGTFLDDQEEMGAVVRKKEDIKQGAYFSMHNAEARQHMIYHPLASNKSDRHMEPFMIDILPQEEKLYTPSSHEGEEFMMVMDGEINVKHGNKKYELKQGDSIYFDSIVPHIISTSSPNGARMLAVMYSPL